MKRKIMMLFLLARSSINIADSIYVIVLMWAIQSFTNNTSYTSFTYAASTFAAIFVVFIGPYIDKKSPTKVITYSILIQVICIFIFIMLLINKLSSWSLIIMMLTVLISSFCSSIFYPANNTFFTKLSEKDFYKKGISIFQTSDQIINFSSFILIGILISFIGSIKTLVISIVLFILGLLFLYILNIFSQEKRETNITSEESYSSNLYSGFKIIKSITPLRLTIPIALYGNVIVAGFIALLPSIAQEKGPIYYSIIYIVFFLGFILGAIFSNSLKTNIKNIYIHSFFMGVWLLLFSLTIEHYYSLIFVLIFGLSSAIINIFDESIYQENTPEKYMGTVLTMKGSILSLASPIGAVVVGFLAFYINNINILIVISLSKIIYDAIFGLLNVNKIKNFEG